MFGMEEGFLEVAEAESIELGTVIAREQGSVTRSEVKTVQVVLLLVLDLQVSLTNTRIKHDQLLTDIPISTHPCLPFPGNISRQQIDLGCGFHLRVLVSHIHLHFSPAKGLEVSESEHLRCF